MLDLQIIREDPERVKKAIQDKNTGDPQIVDRLIQLDAERREALTELQVAQARSNVVSKEIGALMGQGKKQEAQERIAESGELKEKIKVLGERASRAEAQVQELLLEIPNLPHPSVPYGRTSADNQELFVEGEAPEFDFEPLPHW